MGKVAISVTGTPRVGGGFLKEPNCAAVCVFSLHWSDYWHRRNAREAPRSAYKANCAQRRSATMYLLTMYLHTEEAARHRTQPTTPCRAAITFCKLGRSPCQTVYCQWYWHRKFLLSVALTQHIPRNINLFLLSVTKEDVGATLSQLITQTTAVPSNTTQIYLIFELRFYM